MPRVPSSATRGSGTARVGRSPRPRAPRRAAITRWPTTRRAREGELHISSETSTKTHYPLTLLVEPAAELALRILYDRRSFEPEEIARVWRHLETLLTQMGARPPATLEELEAALPESDRSERLRGELNRERAHLSKLRTIKPRAVSLPDAE